MLFNAQSLCNKLSELHHLLYTGDIDIILITESWLHPDISNGLLDPDSRYSIIRHDRCISNGGGVCVFIRKPLVVIPVNFDTKHELLELICFDLVDKKCSTPTRIFLAYRPPSINDSAISYLYQLIECLTTYQNKSFVNIITGDLNLPKIDWCQLLCPSDKFHKSFFEFAIDNGFIQVVNFPTRKKNLLDIVLVDDVLRILHVSHHPPFVTSDHDSIRFSIFFECEETSYSNVEVTDKYCWYNANFDTMKLTIQGIDWLQLVYANPSASGMWDTFLHTLYNIVDECVPRRISSRRHKIQKTHCPKHKYPKAVHKVLIKNAVCGSNTE